MLLDSTDINLGVCEKSTCRYTHTRIRLMRFALDKPCPRDTCIGWFSTPAVREAPVGTSSVIGTSKIQRLVSRGPRIQRYAVLGNAILPKAGQSPQPLYGSCIALHSIDFPT